MTLMMVTEFLYSGVILYSKWYTSPKVWYKLPLIVTFVKKNKSKKWFILKSSHFFNVRPNVQREITLFLICIQHVLLQLFAIMKCMVVIFWKVLIAWYVYTQQCKHKKSRVQAAMERRRCRLIKNGLTQWLRVADDMSAMRKQVAVRQQTKVLFIFYITRLKFIDFENGVHKL